MTKTLRLVETSSHTKIPLHNNQLSVKNVINTLQQYAEIYKIHSISKNN